MNFMACQVGQRRATVGSMYIALVNSKGGVGKSTLACHLAIWLFDRGYRVAVIDADRQGTSAEWISKAEPTITVLFTDDSDAIQRARDELLASHDFVIADGPGEDGEAANAVTVSADLAVLPLEPTKLCVRALKGALKTIQVTQEVREGKPDTILVLSKVRMNSRRTRVLKKQLRAAGYCVAEAEIRFLDAIADSGDSAVTRDVTAESQNAASDMESFFWELLGSHLTARKASNG